MSNNENIEEKNSSKGEVFIPTVTQFASILGLSIVSCSVCAVLPIVVVYQKELLAGDFNAIYTSLFHDHID